MLARNIVKALGLALTLSVAVVPAAEAKDKKKAGKEKKEKKEEGKKGGKEAAATYTPPYGMAGCGLGSLVFKDDTMMAQVTAGTLNATGFQTSAISSTHSSNCQERAGEAALRVEQEVFVAANLRALEEDVSAGGGSYTEAFAPGLGCEGAQYDAFIATSKANYQAIFNSDDAQVVYAQYMQALRANPELNTRCERVIAKS
jgi:hypothetical protein